MTTIFPVITSANRLNAHLTGVHQPRSALLSQVALEAHQSQFAALSQVALKARQPQFAALSQVALEAYQPQFAALGQAVASLGKMHESQFAALSQVVLKAYQPQFAALGQAVASLGKMHESQFAALSQVVLKAYQPLLDVALAAEFLRKNFPDTGFASNTSDRLPQRLTDREVAAMLTVAAFLIVYISFGLLIKHNMQ